jgi:hypothetical protein
MTALAVATGFLDGLGRGIDMRRRKKEADALNARLDAQTEAYARAMGRQTPAPRSGMEGAGVSGTWTPAPPGPKPTDLPFHGSVGPMTYDGRAPQGESSLGFGSATMTPQEMLIAGAQARGLDPIDVATAISYETGGRFDPMIAGPTTRWGTHRGLIQFGEPQARKHGADFSSPDAAWRSQLDPDTGAVWRYLEGAGVRPGMGLPEIYSAINAGAVGRMNASDAHNGGAPGTVADKVAGMGPHREKAAAFLGGTWTPNDAPATKRAKLRAEWAGFRAVPDELLDYAIGVTEQAGMAPPPRPRGLPIGGT